MTGMSLADRVASFAARFARWPASWPHLVREQGRDVLYATWVLGNDYRVRLCSIFQRAA